MNKIKFFSICILTLSIIACNSDKKQARKKQYTVLEDQAKGSDKSSNKQKTKKKRTGKKVKASDVEVNTDDFVITPKDKRVVGQFYTDLQKSLSLTDQQTKKVKELLFEHRDKKQELDKQGKWKGGENRKFRRQLGRETDILLHDALGEDLYYKYKAFEKAWEA